MLRKFVAIAILFSGLISPQVCAEEPIEAFLEALEERGHFDVALRYIQRMSHSDLAPSRFKEEAEYRRGMLLVNSARSTRNPAVRTANLDEAKQALESFIESHSQHPAAALARSQLGNILVERARGLMSRAKDDEAHRQALVQEAAEIYAAAYKSLLESREELGNQFKALVGNRDPDSKAKLNEVKSQYVQTYLAVARVLFEQAETLKDDERKYKEKLTEAATAFEEVTQKYRSYSAGVYALLYEGECYQLMGEDARALTYFKELLQNQDNSPVVRRLKSRALAKSIESWLKAERNAGPDKAISAANQWLQGKKPDEDRDPAWLELRLALAKAYKQKSESEAKEVQASRALKEARDITKELARRRSPIQKEAQQFLVALGTGGAEADGNGENQEAKSFGEARDAAKKSLDAMKLANATVSILSSQLAKVADPERRAKIESKLEEAKKQSTEMSSSSLELFERAASLATEDDLEDLNGVRYYLAYLYYNQKRYRLAAVLAGFVATHQSDSVAAKECANVALAARQRLYQLLDPDQRESQAAHIARLAELMISKWPGQSQSDAALITLLDITVRRGDIKKAEEYLARIPEDTPKRASAELKIGQAIWRQYLSQLRPGEESTEELVQLQRRAQEILASGIDRLEASTPNESAIRGALSLAQIYADTGRSREALNILTRRRLGALSLAEADSPWLAKIPGLKVEAYKTAIRAHISSAASGDSDASINAAQELINQLREELAQQPGGKEKMIAIYVSLARDLERQLTITSPAARQSLSKGFESFLLSAAKGTKDVTVLNWVGATFYGLGNGLLQGNETSPEAQRYFTEAASAYRQVLTIAQNQPDALSEAALTQAKVNQAKCLRQIGKYKESVDLFAHVLSKRNRVLNIQIEAAKTLQQWGSRDAQGYWKAIQGDMPGTDGQNSIWGWGRIAKLVARNEKYRDTFHEARYNIAWSRFRYAMASPENQKTKLLQRAKADILMTKKLFNLGNRVQTERYEDLLKSIQNSLGESPVGFAKAK